jgi:hypothetical protein
VASGFLVLTVSLEILAVFPVFVLSGPADDGVDGTFGTMGVEHVTCLSPRSLTPHDTFDAQVVQVAEGCSLGAFRELLVRIGRVGQFVGVCLMELLQIIL